jgi:hypothetical protein
MESVRGEGQFVPDAKIDSLFSIRPIFSTSKFVIDDSAVAVTNPIASYVPCMNRFQAPAARQSRDPPLVETRKIAMEGDQGSAQYSSIHGRSH